MIYILLDISGGSTRHTDHQSKKKKKKLKNAVPCHLPMQGGLFFRK